MVTCLRVMVSLIKKSKSEQCAIIAEIGQGYGESKGSKFNFRRLLKNVRLLKSSLLRIGTGVLHILRD